MNRKGSFFFCLLLLFCICGGGCKQNNVEEDDAVNSDFVNTPEDNDDYVEDLPIGEEQVSKISLGINHLNLNGRQSKYNTFGLPIIRINTVNEEEPTCDYVNVEGKWGKTIQNATKVPARMTIIWGNEILYDSGEYKEEKSGVTIRIRGNTTAYSEKKPYKIKLQAKSDLLKHIRKDNNNHSNKNWLLLKDATTLNSIIGFSCSKMLMPIGTWIPEWDFVDVYINNIYRGCYLLIESVEKNKTRINISDEGFLIERDTYWYTEDLYFETPDPFKDVMKYTFKYPEENINSDSLQFSYVKDYVTKAYNSLYSGGYEDFIDIDTFSSWVLVHDIIGNSDYAGSNIYISKKDSTDLSKLKMETPWDFDNILKTPNGWGAIHDTPVFFYTDLFPSLNKNFNNAYVRKWDSVRDFVWPELEAYLLQLQEIYEQSLDESRKNDAELYGSSGRSMQSNIEQIQNWFETRSENLEEWISAELR